MVLAVNIQSNDIVFGNRSWARGLTKYLLETGAEVVAVEKDDNLFAFLQRKIFVRNRKQKTCF